MILKKLSDFLYKWRFLIGICIILLGVVCNINGSSISCWKYYIPIEDTHTLFGESRLIRSDEWATFTPFIFAQSYGEDAYSWFNDIIRGTETDTFIVYAQPVKHILSVLFRPFLTGFLLFGTSRGLAFFWWSRFVCVWLVNFELGMLITKGRKLPSTLMAILVSLAPVLQWWFAINGLAEMLIFGGLAILMLHRYMNDSRFWHRLIYLFVLYCCAGGYVMTFYPAWMVPLAYAYLGLAIWIFVSNFRTCKMKWFDWISLVGTIALFGGSMLYIFNQSKETIDLVLNTAYPGQRIEIGGEGLSGFFKSYGNLFFLFNPEGVPANVCEASMFFDFFPLGIVLGLYVMIKNKKADLLLIILAALEGILAIYLIFGMPEMLAKLTLLSFSTSNRAIIGAGFINILILIRAMSLYRKEINSKVIYLVAFIYMIFCIIGSSYAYGTTYLTKEYLFVIAILSFILANFLLRIKSRPYHLTAYMLIIFMCTTAGVNPVQYGTAGITDNNVAKSIQEVVARDSESKWVVDNLDYPASNYTIIQGAPTINSTNVYPTLERWSKLDPKEINKNLYNRYAHIMVELVKVSDASETFTLLSADHLKLTLDIEELKELDVKYIFTKRDLEGVGFTQNEVKLKSDVDGFRIYEIR